MRRFFALFSCIFLPLSGTPQPALKAAPIRNGKGPATTKVVTIHDDRAIRSYTPNQTVIQGMIDRGVAQLTGKPDATTAWQSLVSTDDVVGIKVYTKSGGVTGTRMPVVEAVIEGLLQAGLAPGQIIVWDKRLEYLRAAGYLELADRYGIRLEGSAEKGYDESTFYDTALVGKLVWGDLEFGRKGKSVGRRSFVSKLITEDITRFISIAPLLNHYQAGVAGHIYSLALGSADNTYRFEASKTHLNIAAPELYAMEILGDRVALNIVDALICQYQGERQSLLHYSSILNELRLSRDPVALDVLSIRELEKQRKIAELPLQKPDMELYYNAGLLQLGTFDPKKVEVERIEAAD